MKILQWHNVHSSDKKASDWKVCQRERTRRAKMCIASKSDIKRKNVNAFVLNIHIRV